MPSNLDEFTLQIARRKLTDAPHRSLKIIYAKILRTLQQMPETYPYRKFTTDIVTERATIVEQNKDVKAIEDQINCGLVKDIIQQAENELVLSRKILEWKPWEPLVQKPPKNQWVWPPVQ